VSGIARLLVGVAHALGTQADPDAHVHFHSGDNGRPYVCDNPRCESPCLDLAEVEWWEITQRLLAP
jgi:hypothetical protein